MKRKVKKWIVVGCMLLFVIVFILALTLPTVAFVNDFKSAIETKDADVIEMYFKPPFELISEEGYLWVDCNNEDLANHALFAYDDSEYTVYLNGYKIESFSSVLLHFEGRRVFSDNNGGILFYNVRIVRNGLSWVVSSYETDI